MISRPSVTLFGKYEANLTLTLLILMPFKSNRISIDYLLTEHFRKQKMTLKDLDKNWQQWDLVHNFPLTGSPQALSLQLSNF